MKMDYDTSHPLAFGMPERGVAYFSRAQAFRIDASEKDSETAPKVIARYPNESLLLSGWSQGEDRIMGHPSVVDAPLGDGRVILFGFNVINRWQTPAVLKLFFNAIFYRG